MVNTRARSRPATADNAQGGAGAVLPATDRASRARVRTNVGAAAGAAAGNRADGDARDARRSSRSVGSPMRPKRQAVVKRENEGGYLTLHTKGRRHASAEASKVVVFVQPAADAVAPIRAPATGPAAAAAARGSRRDRPAPLAASVAAQADVNSITGLTGGPAANLRSASSGANARRAPAATAATAAADQRVAAGVSGAVYAQANVGPVINRSANTRAHAHAPLANARRVGNDVAAASDGDGEDAHSGRATRAQAAAATRSGSVAVPAAGAGDLGGPVDAAMADRRATRAQAAAATRSDSVAAPAVGRTLPGAAALGGSTAAITTRAQAAAAVGTRSGSAVAPATGDLGGSVHAAAVDRRTTRAQAAAAVGTRSGSAAVPAGGVRTLPAAAGAPGGTVDAAAADRRTTRAQAAAAAGTSSGSAAAPTADAQGTSTRDENDRRFTRSTLAAAQTPPQSTSASSRPARVPAAVGVQPSNAPLPADAATSRRRPAPALSDATNPAVPSAPTANRQNVSLDQDAPAPKRARIAPAAQAVCQNEPSRRVQFASDNEREAYNLHCRKVVDAFRSKLTRAAKTIYVVMKNPEFWKLIGSILDEGDLTSELTEKQVQALTFLEWGGWICFRCDSNIPELQDASRPCNCPSECEPEFSWDGLTSAAEYIDRANTYVKDRLEFLAGQLKEELGEKKFKTAFPNYGKRRSREFEAKLKRAQREYFEYGWATMTAPIILADWTLGDAEKLIHPGRLGDELTYSKKGARKLSELIRKGDRRLNANLKNLKCGDGDNENRCQNPADFLSSSEHYVAGHYKNGRLHYCTRIGVSVSLLGNSAESMPLLPLEWGRTLVSAACSDAVGCKCGASCEQRTVTERGCQFMTALIVLPGKGRAVFALEDIPRGSFLAKMGGEVLQLKPEETRGRERHMLLSLPEFDEDLALSPDEVYNSFIFENHSCAPNVIQTLELDGRRDPRWGRFAVHARADIARGSELLWDYYVGEFLDVMTRGDEDREEEADRFHFVCECGSRYCRYSKAMWRKFNEEREKKAKKRVKGSRK